MKAYSTVDTVWANVNQTGTSERFQNDASREIPIRNATIRIHWRSDINERWRIVYDNLEWDIKGIGAVGRNDEMDLFCQTDASRKATP